MSCLFIDESKSKGYTMVAAVASPSDLKDLRRQLRGYLLPGQRRTHFTKESDNRKRHLLSEFNALGFQTEVFHCATTSDAVGRRACLRALVSYAASEGHSEMVFERDASIEQSDRQILYREVQQHGLVGSLAYTFEAPHGEPLLWVADAVAWSYAKGGDWRRRASPLISGVTLLST